MKNVTENGEEKKRKIFLKIRIPQSRDLFIFLNTNKLDLLANKSLCLVQC
jgi:hypothetical protein